MTPFYCWKPHRQRFKVVCYSFEPQMRRQNAPKMAKPPPPAESSFSQLAFPPYSELLSLLPQSKDTARGSALNAGFRKVANLPAFIKLYTYAAFELLNSTSWHPQKV
jgi:hypothetical protein